MTEVTVHFLSQLLRPWWRPNPASPFSIEDMAMGQVKEVTNIGKTSKTSEATEYYTSIAESTLGSAPTFTRVYPTLLKEYQSTDIKEVKRVGLSDIKYVKKGKGTVLGKGGQASIHEVVVNTGVNARYETYAMKKFKGRSINNLYGQWEEKIHGLNDYYGGFICKFYGYCRDYESYGSGSDEEEEEVLSDGILNKTVTSSKEVKEVVPSGGILIKAAIDSIEEEEEVPSNGILNKVATGSNEEEEEVPSDGVLSKAATGTNEEEALSDGVLNKAAAWKEKLVEWMKKLWFQGKYKSPEESSEVPLAEERVSSFCLLMKKYDCSLRNVLDELKLKPGVAVTMMVQIAVGMKIVHQEGILHRDLKADNIFVYKSEEDNMPWGANIGDFDIAESVEGTAFWRAPEILKAIVEQDRLRLEKKTLEEMQAMKVNIPLSPMADVYSYGMTCYEILTGGIPFKGRKLNDYDCVIKQGMRPELPANLNPEIRDLIHRCWHQDPQQRPTFEAIMLEFKRILHELPRFMALMDEVGNVPPSKNRPPIDECIERLERIEEELRAKYPKELFVERDELDFVELEMRWTKTIKKFVTKFGHQPYIDHPSLPWSLWFKRMKGLMKVKRLAVEVAHAIPYIKVKIAISRLRLYITEVVFKGYEGGNLYADEEGVLDENQTLILLQNWNEREGNLPPLVNPHYGCIQMSNYGHFEGNKDYPICDWCKEEEEWDVIADVKFRLFDDKFASELS